MEAVKCPVCNGTGQVPVYFYYLEDWDGTSKEPQVCRSCKGKGHIVKET